MITGLVFLSHTEQFNLEDKVIKTKVSYQNLNRISIKGDKIDSILGIDSAFHFEKNEKTGEVFIRPTEDNGYTPISLSVTTMSGKTQDLLLEPVDREANSIELISDTSVSEDLLPSLDLLGGEASSNSSDYEEIISSVMKKFINLPANQAIVEVNGIADRFYSHLKAVFELAYHIDGFLCLKFRITAEQEGTFVLDERMFAQKGDVALSLSSLNIAKNKTDVLYVLRK
jgi:hypothetical protein